MPDFTNLKNQWATLNPTGVDSASYAATVTTTAPACPASTAGTSAWTVDPSAALPTMGEVATSGMTTGLPSTIPSGSITVSGTSDPAVTSGSGSSQTPSSDASNSPSVGGTSGGSSSTSVSASSSATSQAAGSRTVPTPVEVSDKLLIRTFLAIAGVSFGAMVFL